MTDRYRLSRRGFLVGAGLAVLGAGGGVAAGLLADRSPAEVEPPNPKVLLAAAQAERDLLRAASAASTTDEPTAALLRQVRADHEAHLAAIVAEIAFVTASGTPTVSSSPPTASGVARDDLRKLESSAATAAAKRALALTGRDAALLASIAACEASHAELLA